MSRALDVFLTALAVIMVLAVTLGYGRAEIVTRVVDVDTVRIGAERIRLRGIDTPELSQPRCKAERGKAIVAKRRLVELVEGKDVQVDRVGKDRYGRTLAVLRLGQWDVGSILVAEGLAMPWQPGKTARERRAAAWCEGSR